MPSGINIINAQMIQSVYAYFSMAMYNIVIFHNNAYMYYNALFVIKKSKVAGFAFLNKAKGSPCVACCDASLSSL